MVTYSISSGKRLPVWFVLGLVSSLLLGVLQALFDESDIHRLWAPSGVMMFAVMTALTEFAFKRFAIIARLMGIPNFSGTYVCTLVREREDGRMEESEARCTIQQGFYRISISFVGRGCVSYATSAGVILQGDGLGELQWTYASHDTTGMSHPEKYHPGTTQIQYHKVNGGIDLIGRYFTANGRRGSVALKPLKMDS